MKICKACGRNIGPRKKWEKNWDDIKYCSERCRRNKRPRSFEKEILTLLEERGADKSICPSEVLQPEEKSNKDLMELVRISARKLVTEGKIVITQKNQIVDPSRAKGAIRLKLKKRMSQ